MHGTSPATPVPLTTYGGLVTLASPDSVPVGAATRCYDMDFLVGDTRTRDCLSNVYSRVDAEVGPNGPAAASSSTWLNPGNITAQDGSYTSFSPVSGANSLTITEFAFDIPSSDSITGLVLKLHGYSNSPANLTAQLLINGVPTGEIKTVGLPQTPGDVIFGSSTDLWQVPGLSGANLNSLTFGAKLVAESSGFTGATAFLDYAAFTAAVSTGSANFQFLTPFVAQDGSARNLFLDAQGNFWVENVTSTPGTLTLVRSGIAQNCCAVAADGPGVKYQAISNYSSGADMPLQYTPNWIDRITQVGPGKAPTFTPISSSSTQYPITAITQPAAKLQGSSYFLQSQGPGSTTPGSVVTFYYLDSTVVPGPDSDLVAAFNSGNPVYLYASFTGTPQVFGPQVVLVTGIGLASPPGQPRKFYYFTFSVSSVAYTYFQGSGHPGYTANYQRSLATLTTSTPVPNVTVGSQITVSGVTPTAWNSNWTVSQTPNASTMAITGSQVSGGVATFNYAVTNGTAAPAAGELVTITNTLNAGGALNVAGASIVSVSGTTTGTFTINVSLPDFAFQAEDGAASTAGTKFCFDPGAGLLGTGTNPIFGNATAFGVLVFNSSGLFIDPGIYQGTQFFITRNGLYTCPAPPVTFAVPQNTTSLQVTDLLIGPSNVIARGIAITEAGQNGVPGANFFTLPTPVAFYSQDVKYTATAFFVNDNTSSSTTLFFTSAIIDSALAIDVYGYNLFNNIEIGDPGWIANYAGRNFYGGCVNKVQNFNNLSFDGGFLSGQTAPAGWTAPDAYGGLVPSPKFGNSYYIKNTSNATLASAALISQSAYQDAYQQPILNPNTTYSVRLTASNPSGVTGGDLVISLVSAGVAVGSYTLALSSLTSDLKIYSGTLLTTGLSPVPLDLTLQVAATNLAVGADVLLDRFDVIPTEIPVLATTAFGSYAGLPEQVDAVTGKVEFTSENQQPVNGAMVMYDTLYALKGWGGDMPGSSLYSLQASANLEPAQWQEPEVSQRSGGAIGPLAFDLAEQWFLGASRAGLYLFVGGQPGKIMQEIYQVWDAINWKHGNTIWVKVDTINRKIYCGVPLPTPNFWLPNAPANANPTSPNVILMCNYQGIDSGEQLRASPQMHTTMFGTLNAIDMRRKWSLFQIPCPYANFMAGTDDQQLYLGNGRGNSKVYKFDPNALTDDGITVDSLYTTAGLPDGAKRSQMPGLGNNRVRWGYFTAALESEGAVNVTLYPNKLLGPTDSTVGYNTWQLPGGFTPGKPALNDAEASLNFVATRTFLEFRQNDGKGGFSLSNLVLQGKKDVWNAMRGAK